jgi:hypothetical protein
MQITWIQHRTGGLIHPDLHRHASRSKRRYSSASDPFIRIGHTHHQPRWGGGDQGVNTGWLPAAVAARFQGNKDGGASNTTTGLC